MNFYYHNGEIVLPIKVKNSTEKFLEKVDKMLEEIRKEIMENATIVLSESADELCIDIELKNDTKEKIHKIVDFYYDSIRFSSE